MRLGMILSAAFVVALAFAVSDGGPYWLLALAAGVAAGLGLVRLISITLGGWR